MPTRSYTTKDYRYGFNGKEKDFETANDNYDFGARIYDGRLGRWLSTEPYYKDYIPISPFVFGLNNAINFYDKDGNIVVGSDNQAVTYKRNDDGTITWSSNATDDIIKVGNSMLATKSGEIAFNKWQSAETKVHIQIDYETMPKGRTAETIPYESTLNSDGQYKEIKVVFYDKKIKAEMATPNNRWYGAGYEEALGAIGTHEVYHNDKEQIQLDLHSISEISQDPIKNKPINAEINYREQYHYKNNIPGIEWKEPYLKNGYDGLQNEGEIIILEDTIPDNEDKQQVTQS